MGTGVSVMKFDLVGALFDTIMFVSASCDYLSICVELKIAYMYST